MRRYAPLPPPRANIADPSMPFGAYRFHSAPPTPPGQRAPTSSADAAGRAVVTTARVVMWSLLAPVALLALGLLAALAFAGGLLTLPIVGGVGAVALTGVLRVAGVIPPRRRAPGRRR